MQRFGGGPLTLADATIYLPTRRAARCIAEIFAKQAGGATLLPDFRPLGDVDEDELLLDPTADELELKPAIKPIRRRMLLAALIRRWSEARGRVMTFGQAAGLARSLADVMDDVERQGADLAKLAELAPLSLAEHWAEVKEFLSLIHTAWPEILADEHRVNPAAHRNDALRALAKKLQNNPPDAPVIAAGSTGSIPATADLLGVIARLPNGAVVLPGLDRILDEDSWERLDPGHPQFALKQLLGRIGVARTEVADWIAAPLSVRETLLREVLRPAPTTDAWRALAERDTSELANGFDGLSLMEAADPSEEASLIALLLREALEIPERSAALVTRDRALARRVTAELGRWNIVIDDSAGRPLSQTPPGSFLCLLGEAADNAFAPVPLLALLKHPLTMVGHDVASFRAKARELDLVLRGPRPDSGLAGIASAISHASDTASDEERHILAALRTWFVEVARVLKPLEAMLSKPEISIADVLKAHIGVAERLTRNQEDAVLLWQGTAGGVANLFVQELAELGCRPAAHRSQFLCAAISRLDGRKSRPAALRPAPASCDPRSARSAAAIFRSGHSGRTERRLLAVFGRRRSVVFATDAPYAWLGTTRTCHRTFGT